MFSEEELLFFFFILIKSLYSNIVKNNNWIIIKYGSSKYEEVCVITKENKMEAISLNILKIN